MTNLLILTYNLNDVRPGQQDGVAIWQQGDGEAKRGMTGWQHRRDIYGVNRPSTAAILLPEPDIFSKEMQYSQWSCIHVITFHAANKPVLT